MWRDDTFAFRLIQDEQAATELALIAGQFAEGEKQENQESNKGDDLLAMMDDLWSCWTSFNELLRHVYCCQLNYLILVDARLFISGIITDKTVTVS